MRAWVFSDLHVDAAAYELPPAPANLDCIIIAGDVADGHERAAKWLHEHAVPRGLLVVYVLGNHDFYGTDLAEDVAGIYRKAGVILLHPSRPSFEFAGVRFIGSTLWTDYAIAGDVDAARAWARWSMPDIVSVDLGLRRIGTRDLLERHRQQRDILERELDLQFDGKTVVVTHHAPHARSLASPLLTPSDASFASDLTQVIETFRPALWVHGHTHSTVDYVVGDTRIVCNARGYARVSKDGRTTENKQFNPALVVEI